MADAIEVARAAATRMGTAARLTSLNDNTTLARTLKGVWDIERKAALRDGAWNFATVTRSLAAANPAQLEGGALPASWAQVYQLPGDCLRFLAIVDDTVRGQFERCSDANLGDVLFCDAEAPLPVRMVVDRPIERWDASAADAFALRLAWRCGRKIAGSAFDHETCWAEYRKAIADAKTTDAREGPPIEHEESDWILTRQTGRW